MFLERQNDDTEEFASGCLPERLTAGALQRHCDSDPVQKCDNHFSRNTPKENNYQKAQRTDKKKKKKIKKTHLFIPAKLCLRNLPANKTH